MIKILYQAVIQHRHKNKKIQTILTYENRADPTGYASKASEHRSTRSASWGPQDVEISRSGSPKYETTLQDPTVIFHAYTEGQIIKLLILRYFSLNYSQYFSPSVISYSTDFCLNTHYFSNNQS